MTTTPQHDKAWTVLKITRLRKLIINNTPVSLMAFFLGISQMSIRLKAAEESLSLVYIDQMDA